MARIKFYNTNTKSWEYADISTTVQSGIQVVETNETTQDTYDLRIGVAVKDDFILDASGKEVEKANLHYHVTDYIPIKASTEYICCCVTYTIYDKNKTLVTSKYDIGGGYGAIKEFTPEADGFVRISYRGSGKYMRLCKKSEMRKTVAEYDSPKISPISDATIPCSIDFYGDSNSYGYGLRDVKDSWANRLGNLITSMPSTIRNHPSVNMSVFSQEYSSGAQLGNFGKLYLKAYTDSFTINGNYITHVKVIIDGEEQTPMTSATATYEVEEGYHELELQGVEGGNNIIDSVDTTKIRSFTNHAVSGTGTGTLNTATPTGNIVMVMYGTNDRGSAYGVSLTNFVDFAKKCKEEDRILYFFSPIPASSTRETENNLKLQDVINQIPDVNYIDVYKDMMLYSMLSTETIFQNDGLHINDLGHKILFVIGASALKLCALNTDLGNVTE